MTGDFLLSVYFDSQVPAKQHLLQDPGLSGAAPVPEHAQCRPLGEQASEVLWGEAASPQL